MPSERRVVRRLKTPRKLVFDDRLWPVNIAIMVLVAFLVGIIIVRFSEKSGNVSLLGLSMIAGLISTAVLIMWGLGFVRQRTMRRGIQLATVLSLITHAVLLLVLATWPLATHVAEAPEEPPEPEQPELTMPDLVAPRLNNGEQRKPDFLRPVETRTAETGSTEWTRTIVSVEDLDPKLQRSFLSDDEVRPHPSVSPRRQPAETAPHEAIAESLLSRRESELPRVASEPVELPDAPLRVDESVAEQLEPQPTTPARTSVEPELASQTQPAEPAAEPSEPAIAMRRPDQPVPSADDRADAPRDESRPSNPPSINETMVALAEAVPNKVSPQDKVAAAPSEIQRQSGDVQVADSISASQQHPSIEPQRQAVVAVRRDDSSEPTKILAERPERSRTQTDPQRLRSESQVAAAEAPARTELKADELEDEVRLAPTALSRSVDGLTGVGDSQNLGHSLRARGGPSLVASASATRANPTQDLPQGPAMQPSQRVDTPQLRSGALRPSSVFQAQAVEVAVAYGSQYVGKTNATAAATIHRDASDSMLDEVTASVGVGTVDMGVQRTISEDGSARAAGGGRPELNPAKIDTAWKHTAPRIARNLVAVSTVPDADGGAADSAGSPSEGQPQEGVVVADQTNASQESTADEASADDPPAGEVQRQTALTSAEDLSRPTGKRIGAPTTQATAAATEIVKPAAWSEPDADSTGTARIDFDRAAPRDQLSKSSQLALAKTTIDMPEPEASASAAEKVAGTPGLEAALATRHDTAADTIFIPQVDVTGPGGVFVEPQANVGVSTRRATTDSELVALSDHRFVVRDRGGEISLGGVDTVAAPAFSKRMSRIRGQQLGSNPGQDDARIDEAIELGLDFLARHQSPHGNWSLHHFAAGKPYQDQQSRTALHADTGATGLALLSFLGAGYHHQGEKYGRIVDAGLQSLVRGQQENGSLFVNEDETSNQCVGLYSHGIAAIALCEAYGMTLDEELREPAEKALDYIVNTQHPRRGGWRYQPRIGSDTSVTGWMMMALKSGQMSQLEVPQEAWSGLEHFMETATVNDRPHLFRYNPYAPDTKSQRHGRFPTDTMTAVGLLIRIYSGSRRTDEEMIFGAEYLAENLPTVQKRDTYYWYYATQIMFHMGGKYWDMWRESLFPLLADSQITEGPLAGSWDPYRPVRDKWARHAGRVYITTMNLLSLEVAYRHLPIYEEVSER